MALNRREWDRDKETWEEGSWFSSATQGGDDDHNEGKRRKFNNGILKGYETSQYWNDKVQDPTHSQDYPSDEHPLRGPITTAGNNVGFHNSKKRLVPSEPSPHVIFLGLDQDFTEADLQAYLSEQGYSIETASSIDLCRFLFVSLPGCTVGKSKGFGFAQFSTVEQARAFVDPVFPFIQVPPPASHGATAAAAFHKALHLGSPHGGRRVKIDYSQSANPGDRNRFGRPAHANDGTRDIGNAQAAVLLFRGLDPLSGVQAIAQAMRACQGAHLEGAKGMKRIILVKDKVTMASWGFAFVEFKDIQAILGATMSPQIHPNGFRISDRPVAASFAHPYSFQLLSDMVLRDDASLPSSVALGGNEGKWVRYWDEASTVAVLEFRVEEIAPEIPVSGREKREKKRNRAIDLDNRANLAASIEASALPISDKPVTLNFKGSAGGKTLVNSSATAKPAVNLGFSVAGDLASDDDQPAKEEHHSIWEAKTAAFGRVAPMMASKKIVNNITKWNQVQEELKPAMVTASASSVNLHTSSSSPSSLDYDSEFSDISRLACLLCSRQFKSLDQLKRHNQESDLHKKNLRDAGLQALAHEKVDGLKAVYNAQLEPPRYRDRASERRIMHNQPEAPCPEGTEAIQKAQRYAEGPVKPSSPPLTSAPHIIHPGQDESNVGNKLLKMMGWKAGTGLGIDGEGRVDPIQTAIYASGAGLGASKGKEVGKYQEGYAGYVHMAQDATRQRYDSK
ncbi:hypothetical protein EVG20_g9523 [Dentipellis fragilis]|uniref:G-patch domain-containing protein n=1 Tax=Dentipellis fragilis TaxID=205917 RepID=A0A4Y9XYY5_9AGAM|nr:hypothetical protein EVG20_g9523 [Dentipellis fragilis]